MAKLQYQSPTPGHVKISVPGIGENAKATEKDVMMVYNGVYDLPADDDGVKRLIKFGYLKPYVAPTVAAPAKTDSTAAAPASQNTAPAQTGAPAQSSAGNTTNTTGNTGSAAAPAPDATTGGSKPSA